MSNATSFGQQAGLYAKGRPRYPAALFDWIAARSPATTAVWDVATGSGQAAVSLADHFERVVATDIDAAQIDAASPHPRIAYAVAPAERSGLPDASVDAVCVATALHWFAGEAFWAEVARVARPGALFCAWVYDLPRVEGALQADVLDPLTARLDPYWADGNRLAMAGYTAANTQCPFPTLATPACDAGGMWTATQLMDFAQSWSAHLRARRDGQAAALAALRRNALALAGAEPVCVRLPLSVLAARVG